jgi:Bacterial type II and III secretion system protein/FG-GAP-like repeat
LLWKTSFVLATCFLLGNMSLSAQESAKRSKRQEQAASANPKKAKEAYQRGLKAEKEQDWTDAFSAFTEALQEDSANREYALRREIARSQLVEASIERAERDALADHPDQARDELRHALALAPDDEMIRERLIQLAPARAAALHQLLLEPTGPVLLEPLAGTRNFEYRGGTEGAYKEIAGKFDVDASFDVDLPQQQVYFHLENVNFAAAMRALGDITHTFWRPVTHRLFFVAVDTPEKRRAYDVSLVSTMGLPDSATPNDMTEILRLVRDIAGITRTSLDFSTHTITLRSTPQAIAVASELIHQLEQPPGEVMLEMEVLEVDRNAARQLGITPPESSQIFSLSPQQIQEAQQSLEGLVSVIQELVSPSTSTAGLSASQIASLLESGQLSASAIIPPIIAFGGGKSTFLATLPGAAANFSNTLSLVRSGQRILLRAENDTPATFFVGDRVPITLAVYSSSLTSTQFVPGVSSTLYPVTNFQTGTNPVALVTADFNGDAFEDLAVVNHVSNTISIFLGNGDGTFHEGTDIATGNAPVAAVTADFNGDGIPDLAVVNEQDNTFSIFLGLGDGTFALKNTYMTGNNPVAIATADFNGDGKPDLAIVNQTDNTASIFLGNGDGTFTVQTPVTTGAKPSAITTGDFNGDGRLDLAITNENANTVSILLGNGDGTFGRSNDFTTGNTPEAILNADFNEDGKLDLAVANEADNTVSILLGNGDGTFQPQVSYPTGTGPVALATADFNIDGFPDLAISDQTADSVSVLLGNGDGSFEAPLDLSTGTGPAGLAAADFNSDGRTDLAVADSTANTFSLILNNANFVAPGSVSNETPYPNAEYEDVGLKIKATPHMHPDGTITLELHFELRSLSGESINGVPIIHNRTINQTVNVKDNETTALAGILGSAEMNAISGTPGLSELGISDYLAGARNTQNQDTELLILVTPRVVRRVPTPGNVIFAGRLPVESGAGFRPLPVRPRP